MKKGLIVFIPAVLIGILAWNLLRGGLVLVIGSDGQPVKGAQVWLSYHSATAILQDETDAEGQATIPAKMVRRGGWECIIASWEDRDGNRFIGDNRARPPKFPVTIRLSKR